MLSREAMLRELHVRDEYYRRRARQSFSEFIRFTKSDYQFSWFHEEMAGALDSFLDDVLANEIPGLDAFAGQYLRAKKVQSTQATSWSESSLMSSEAPIPRHFVC